MRDGAIRRFNFTADLAWKTLQSVLEETFDVHASSPKTAVRVSYERGLILGASSWLSMIDDRNLSGHSNDDKIAEELYARLPHYADLVLTLLETLRSERGAVE